MATVDKVIESARGVRRFVDEIGRLIVKTVHGPIQPGRNATFEYDFVTGNMLRFQGQRTSRDGDTVGIVAFINIRGTKRLPEDILQCAARVGRINQRDPRTKGT